MYQRVTDAILANTATDFNAIGFAMGQLRTANKRHKRAILARQAREKPADALPEMPEKTTKAKVAG